MASSTFRPKRIRMEILRANSPATDDETLHEKVIPLNIKSTGQQVRGKICNLVQPKPAEIMSIEKFNDEKMLPNMSQKKYRRNLFTIHSSKVFKTEKSTNKLCEQEALRTVSISNSLPTESDEVVNLSDDTSECSTELDPLELERQAQFIEEASVLNDDVIDDELNEFFVNPSIISDESHEKMVKEILENRIDSFTKDCIQHQIKLVDAECQTESQLLSFTRTTTTSVEPTVKPGTETTPNQLLTNSEESQNSEQDYKKEILNYLKRIDKRLNCMELRLAKIEEKCDTNYFSEETEQEDDELDKLKTLKFPIKSCDNLYLLDDLCKMQRTKVTLEQKFRQCVGINEIDTIDKILIELFDPALYRFYKWRHTDAKRSFEGFIFVNNLIFDCVKHHFRMFSRAEFTRQMMHILSRSNQTETEGISLK